MSPGDRIEKIRIDRLELRVMRPRRRFCDQGVLQSVVDFGPSPLWQDFAMRARSDRTDTSYPPFAHSCHDCFPAVMRYRAPGRGREMLDYYRIRTDDLGHKLDRSPDEKCNSPQWKPRTEIVDQMSEVRTRGGKYATPIPAVRVYDGYEA